MNQILMNGFPKNIRKELENIQKLIFPIARKTSKYMFWTFPLIAISLINLVYLLFLTPHDSNTYMMIFIYACVGALGLALYKETRLNKAEIQRIGVKYIIDRIKKSPIVTEEKKKQFIQLVNERPVHAMESFVKFLQEEERMEKNNSRQDEDEEENYI